MGHGEEKDVRHMRTYSMYNPFHSVCTFLLRWKKDKKKKWKKLWYFPTCKSKAWYYPSVSRIVCRRSIEGKSISELLHERRTNASVITLYYVLSYSPLRGKNHCMCDVGWCYILLWLKVLCVWMMCEHIGRFTREKKMTKLLHTFSCVKCYSSIKISYVACI